MTTDSGNLSVPEENRDLAWLIFCVQILPFCAKLQFFANFALARNFCEKFATLRSAIFRKFCNLREDI